MSRPPFSIETFKTVSMAPNEVLIVRVESGTPKDSMNEFAARLMELLETKKILIYAADNVEFLKVQLKGS